MRQKQENSDDEDGGRSKRKADVKQNGNAFAFSAILKIKMNASFLNLLGGIFYSHFYSFLLNYFRCLNVLFSLKGKLIDRLLLCISMIFSFISAFGRFTITAGLTHGKVVNRWIDGCFITFAFCMLFLKTPFVISWLVKWRMVMRLVRRVVMPCFCSLLMCFNALKCVLYWLWWFPPLKDELIYKNAV